MRGSLVAVEIFNLRIDILLALALALGLHEHFEIYDFLVDGDFEVSGLDAMLGGRLTRNSISWIRQLGRLRTLAAMRGAVRVCTI